MACFMVATTPLTFTWSTWFKESMGQSLMCACCPKMPALGITTSMPPKRFAASAMAAAMAASSVTSATNGATSGASGATARSSVGPSRSMASTFAPSRANNVTAARPIPDAAPVTTAVLPAVWTRDLLVPGAGGGRRGPG